MNRELTKLVAEFDQREITDEDAGRMLDYASSVKARLKAAAEVDSQKRSAIKATIGRTDAPALTKQPFAAVEVTSNCNPRRTLNMQISSILS